jgi:hypothetical protein
MPLLIRPPNVSKSRKADAAISRSSPSRAVKQTSMIRSLLSAGVLARDVLNCSVPLDSLFGFLRLIRTARKSIFATAAAEPNEKQFN